jgi:hypothetical protein
VVLPHEWATLFSKEQLGAFLTFLKLSASSREMKVNLVQHLLTRLEADNVAKAQFFEAYAFELAVPPGNSKRCSATAPFAWLAATTPTPSTIGW